MSFGALSMIHAKFPWKLAALVLLLPAITHAETVSTDLPGFVGKTLHYGDDSISSSFDVAAEFSYIDSIVVRVTGRGQDGVMSFSPDGNYGSFLININGQDPPVVLPPHVYYSSFAPPLDATFPNGTDIYYPGELTTTPNPIDSTESVWEIDIGPYFYSSHQEYFAHLYAFQLLFAASRRVLSGVGGTSWRCAQWQALFSWRSCHAYRTASYSGAVAATCPG